jgi:hypothetical protein
VVNRAFVLLVVLALVAGCQSAVKPPTGNGVALRVELLTGGPRQPGLVDFPKFVLYADGTLIIADHPAGAMPTAREYHLDNKEFMRIYDKARSAGLATPRVYYSQAPDAPVLVITFGSGTTRSTTRITAPDSSSPASAVELNPDTDLTASYRRYVPARIAIIAVPRQSDAQSGAPTWPLKSLDKGKEVNGGQCIVYTERETQVLGNAPGTVWSSNGKTYTVFFRPLMPDEADCDGLQ